MKKLLSIAKTSQDIQALKWLITTGKQYQSSCLKFFQSNLTNTYTLIRYIETLLSAGLDVNMLSEEGQPALNKMAYDGEVSSVHLLLQKGGDVNVKTETGLDAMHCAMYSGKLAIVEEI